MTRRENSFRQRATKRKAKGNTVRTVVRTFGAAASVLGYSTTYLRQIRDAGAAGFKASGRIDCEAVKAWMLENASALPAPTVWKDSLGMEKLRAEKRKNDLADGLLIEKRIVADRLQAIFRPMVARIEQLLTSEYPSKVVGLDVPSARIYGKRIFDVFLEAHRLAALEWRT